MNPSLARYPTDLHIDRADFAVCDWRSVLATLERGEYSSMWQAFSETAREALEKQDQKVSKIFWLLADACSMTLQPESKNEPFKPGFNMEGKRSVIPDDFTPADIQFFADVVDGIDNPRLRARLADLVWLKSEIRDSRFALAAIDAYREVPLDLETWMRDGEHCWNRAIGLAQNLKAVASDRLNQIESYVVAKLKSATSNDGFFAFWLSKLLAEFRLGHSASPEIAQNLEEIAVTLRELEDGHKAREYFDAAGHWYRIANEDEKSAGMFIEVAESFAKEALSEETAGTPISALAASLYEDAIQACRLVPRRLREGLGVEKRISELRVLLKNAGQLAIGQFQAIEIAGVDITEPIEHARNSVSGKNSTEALRCFAALHSGANAVRLRAQTLDAKKKYVFSGLFGATQFGRDGRVIAKRAAYGFSNTEADEESLFSDMVKDFKIEMGLIVQSCLLPALDVMHCEHRLSERDFMDIAHHSPIVPRGRAMLFGKGLFAGYDHDFVVAIHLLTPQLEHLVRFHLQQAGVVTAKLDPNGIETEIGLSALIELPETQKVLGENLTFEIKAVFCDAFGPNLRNEIAHGLLDDRECQSIYSVYAWWFALRLVFNTYWDARNADASKKKAAPKEE